MININRATLLYLVFEHICQELEKEFKGIPGFHEFDDVDLKNSSIESIIEDLLEDGDSAFVSVIKEILDIIKGLPDNIAINIDLPYE